MSANWANADAGRYLSYSPGDFAGTGAYTMALLVEPDSANVRLSDWFASGTEKGQFLLDTSLLFGKDDFSDGVNTGYTGSTSWVFVAITKAAGSTTYRMHYWTYASDGSGTMNHAVATGAGNHADESPAATEIRIGWSSGTSMDGDIAVAAFADRAMSDSEIDTLKTNLLSDWQALGFDFGIHLGSWDGTGGSDVVWAGSSGTATENGTVGVGGSNPASFDFTAGDPPAPPPVEYVSQGAAVAGTTSITTAAYGTGWADGDLGVCVVASNHTTEATEPTVAGFDLIGTLNGGGGSQGAGTGNRRLSFFTRTLVTGDDTTPTISLSTGNVMIAAITIFTKPAENTWETAVAAFGAETTAGTSWSQVMTTDPGFDAEDMLLAACAIRDTSTSSAEGFSATGATFSALTERVDSTSETGNDISLHVQTADVLTGPSSAAGTSTATHSTSETGVMGVLRIRSSAADANPAAETAASTGTANAPAPSVKPNAAASSSTAVAQQPTTTVKPNGGNAAATGVAQQPSTTVRLNSAPATATAAALDATVSTAVATNAAAECATATGTAQASTTSVAPGAAAATSTAVANGPAASVHANAETASATGTAQQPTIQTGASDSAPAETATAAGVAHPAAPSVRPSAAPATAAGTAQQPTTSVRVNAECATATGTAAGGSPGVGVGSATALATAAALSMAANVHASAVLAEALATAEPPTVDAGAPATGQIRERPVTAPGQVVNPAAGAAGGQVGEAQPGTPGQVVAPTTRGAVGTMR